MITQQAEEQFKARIKRQAEMDLLLEQLAGKLSKSSRQGKRARSSDQLLAAAAIEIEWVPSSMYEILLHDGIYLNHIT